MAQNRDQWPGFMNRIEMYAKQETNMKQAASSALLTVEAICSYETSVDISPDYTTLYPIR
jgi:hypothetical protein